jgi:hypothetical protein
MLWEPKFSVGCVAMYAFWVTGFGMIAVAWVLEHMALGQLGVGVIIAAGALTVVRDNMRTRRQIAAIAKRREQRDAGDGVDVAAVGLIHPERF